MNQEKNKIRFSLDDGSFEDFFVLEQTVVSGNTYLLVADSQDDDAECLILKETSSGEDDVNFEIIEDEKELAAVSNVFEQLLDDTTIEL